MAGFKPDRPLFRVRNVEVASYALGYSDDILNVFYTATGAVAISLLTAAKFKNFKLIVKDAGGNAVTNNITITPDGSDTIDGAASVVLNTNYETLEIYSDGENWYRI